MNPHERCLEQVDRPPGAPPQSAVGCGSRWRVTHPVRPDALQFTAAVVASASDQHRPPGVVGPRERAALWSWVGFMATFVAIGGITYSLRAGNEPFQTLSVG